MKKKKLLIPIVQVCLGLILIASVAGYDEFERNPDLFDAVVFGLISMVLAFLVMCIVVIAIHLIDQITEL